MRLCGEFTASTMFTGGGTAMYERQPEGVMGIEERIAEVLWKHELTPFGCACEDDALPWAEHVAKVLVAELGLTGFKHDTERWWSTKFYPLDPA